MPASHFPSLIPQSKMDEADESKTTYFKEETKQLGQTATWPVQASRRSCDKNGQELVSAALGPFVNPRAYHGAVKTSQEGRDEPACVSSNTRTQGSSQVHANRSTRRPTSYAQPKYIHVNADGCTMEQTPYSKLFMLASSTLNQLP